MPDTLKQRLMARALEEGFSSVGITEPGSIPQADSHLRKFVTEGHHGQMQWMAERMNWRGNPANLWPEARTVVMLAESYTPTIDPHAVLDMPDRGAISVYAQNKDYHDIVKKRLKRLGRWLLEQEENSSIKVFVDTAPVMEKPLAAAAGLGWQGKHTNLVSRELGSWFFLGAIFTTIEIEPDAPEPENCGTCRACLDICPTNAFPAPFQLDARKCISYLTIEHSGPIEAELRPLLGNHIYGCDDCLAACPWNKFSVPPSDTRYLARDDLIAPELATLSGMTDEQFRKKFSGSPVKRIGRNRFVRNVLYAIGNSGEPTMLPVVRKLLNDSDATVSEAAAWAVAQLTSNS